MTDTILNARPKIGEVVAGYFITAVEGRKVWGIKAPYTPAADALARWIAWDKKTIKERNEVRKADFSAAFIPGLRFALIAKSAK